MSQLEARRRILIARCELQRAEMSVRAAELKNEPLARMLLGALGSARGRSGGGRGLRHPLTWALGIAGLLLLRRPRQILTVLGMARSALALAAKAGMALRLFGQLRSTLARKPRAEDA